jgi:hypothetical protein
VAAVVIVLLVGLIGLVLLGVLAVVVTITDHHRGPHWRDVADDRRDRSRG